MASTALLHQAADILQQGGVIVTDTDTIPGFSCLPSYFNAIQRIIDIKDRPIEKGLILTASNLNLLMRYTQDISEPRQATLLTPSDPTTWIVPARTSVSTLIRGKFKSVAIRVSLHPTIKYLSEALAQPLITTSANRHTQPTPLRMEAVNQELIDAADLLLNGPQGTGKASTIAHFADQSIVRS